MKNRMINHINENTVIGKHYDYQKHIIAALIQQLKQDQNPSPLNPTPFS
jgi:hypothetical protein